MKTQTNGLGTGTFTTRKQSIRKVIITVVSVCPSVSHSSQSGISTVQILSATTPPLYRALSLPEYVDYGAHTVGKWVAGILLEILLVLQICLSPSDSILTVLLLPHIAK